MASDKSLAAAALVVALVALISAIGQLLQQYFSTADGYRRCQSSVIGPWARRTRLRFRWRQFRLETLFTVPHITLHRTTWSSAIAPDCPFQDADWITGSEHGEQKGLGPLISGSSQESSELATWLRFLRAIQWTHKKMLLRLPKIPQNSKEDVIQVLQENRRLTIPVVRLEQKSWDFMPPDVVRPYARTNLGDLAIIARRLGMDWDRFEPSDGVLRAQGNGYNLTSTFVRSVGTMVEINEVLGSDTFSHNLPWLVPVIPEHVERKMLLIPCAASDKMSFGILPGVGSEFMFRDFDVSSMEAVQNMIRHFTHDEGIVAAFASGQWKSQGWCPGISDLLPFIAPMMYRPDQGIMGVPAPDNGLLFRTSVTSSSACFAEFHNQLKNLGHRYGFQSNPYIDWVLDQLADLTSSSDEWIHEVNWLEKYWHDTTSIRGSILQKQIYDAYRAATHALSGIYSQTQPQKFTHWVLISAHIQTMFDHEVVEVKDNTYPFGHSHFPYPASTGRESEVWARRMRVYFDRLPLLADHVFDSNEMHDKVTTLAAWALMMFRAMCWQRCHKLVGGQTVPLEYCGSQIPIYIR